jgi:hypothetical protein
MNPQDPLAQLRPLHLPESDFSWPLAPGWWVLAGLTCIALIVAFAALYRYYQSRAVLRQSRAELRKIADRWSDSANSADAVVAINALIKATALYYQKDKTIASLTQQHWQAWLQNTTVKRHRDACRFEFTWQVYSGDKDLLWANREATLQDCERWLAGHKGRHYA